MDLDAMYNVTSTINEVVNNADYMVDEDIPDISVPPPTYDELPEVSNTIKVKPKEIKDHDKTTQ